MEHIVLSSKDQGKILLVGEGDFSFSAAIFRKAQVPFFATTVESRESLHRLHMRSAENINFLESSGVTVLYGIDATSLHTYTFGSHFMTIIFNFPHVGGKSNIKKNRQLLKLFFQSAVKLLQRDGQIVVTLCKGQGGTNADCPRREWHNSWQITAMAAEAGLILNSVATFTGDDYAGYGSTGYRSQDKEFRTEKALTHVFVRSVGNGIERLLQEDDWTLCHTDVFLNDCESSCLLDMDGHPCRLLVDVIACQLQASVLRCPALHNLSSAETCARLELLRTRVPSDVDKTVIVSLERGPPELIIAAGDCIDTQAIALRCVVYIAGDWETLTLHVVERLMRLRLGCWQIRQSESSSDASTTPQHALLALSIFDVDANGVRASVVGRGFKNGSTSFLEMDLSAMAMAVFSIPSSHWLFTRDKRILTSSKLTRSEEPSSFIVQPFMPWSIHPPIYSHDISVWTDGAFQISGLCRLIQNAAGHCLSHLELIDTFTDCARMRQSHCYRIYFTSLDTALTYATTYACYQRIRLLATCELGFSIR